MYLQDRRGASKLSAVARKLGNDRGNLLWKCCNIRPSEIETLSANLNERACSFHRSMSEYFFRPWPMMLMNGHCRLLVKKCVHICNTPRLRLLGACTSFASVHGVSKSTVAYASSTMHLTQCRILSSLSGWKKGNQYRIHLRFE